MKFGGVEDASLIDFKLPTDHAGTKTILGSNSEGSGQIYVGCAKWNRQDLKGFYPRGTKDELAYYSTQFNSIELNATFYRIFPNEQSKAWAAKTPRDFRFFPKIPQTISHFARLQDTQDLVNAFCDSIAGFGSKLAVPFLQMPDNFDPDNIERIANFLEQWPRGIPLSLELRHTDFYNDEAVSSALYQILEQHQVINIITDTAGRRDLLHMRLTTPSAFVRYVGANHESDYTRLEEWVERIKSWREQGLKDLYFFVHQNLEEESPLLSVHFLKLLNEALGTNVRGPKGNSQQGDLFG